VMLLRQCWTEPGHVDARWTSPICSGGTAFATEASGCFQVLVGSGRSAACGAGCALHQFWVEPRFRGMRMDLADRTHEREIERTRFVWPEVNA